MYVIQRGYLVVEWMQYVRLFHWVVAFPVITRFYYSNSLFFIVVDFHGDFHGESTFEWYLLIQNYYYFIIIN